jgi:hypothetical protein
MASIWGRLKGKYWFVIGMLAYLTTSISSIIRSLMPTGIGDNIYMAIDWFAACVIYFFFGALIGWLVDYWIARKEKKKHPFPIWAILTLLLWIVGSVITAILNKQDWINVWLIIFFPMAFGIFFNGYAFAMLTPKAIEQSFYGKLIFDIFYIAFFFWWLYLEYYFNESKKRNLKLRKVLLYTLFAILLLGLYGCVNSLSK